MAMGVTGYWVGISLLLADPLAGLSPLETSPDRSTEMVRGIHRFLDRQTQRALESRQAAAANPAVLDEMALAATRGRLRKLVGAVDPRLPVEMASTHPVNATVRLNATEPVRVDAVFWPVFADVTGQGLLLTPKHPPRARLVLIPDADQTPESLAGLEPDRRDQAWGLRLAHSGCQVLIPTLIDRRDEWSGSETAGRWTNQPHREWIYRQAYELGRHIIGYELAKIESALDWLTRQEPAAPTGIVGYGEGGLLALYAAALDPRVDVAMVSGYFGPREGLWSEPIYRNVFGLLEEFGDAEIAALVAPRQLIVEYSPLPRVDGPPAPREGRSGAAPGQLVLPELVSVRQEVARARELGKPAAGGKAPVDSFLTLISAEQGPIGPGSVPALAAFLNGLSADLHLADPPEGKRAHSTAVDPDQRQRQQVTELVEHTQRRLRRSEAIREQFFWDGMRHDAADWEEQCASRRQVFREAVIGRFDPPTERGEVRGRFLKEGRGWRAYEITLDVWPEVFAWGYLLVPDDLKSGEKRPVVVCQHGLEGLPEDCITEDPNERGFHYYQAFAARLAERGFITYAPHNPYRGQDTFRSLQRKANPLGKSLFSVIVAQHQRTLDWLAGLDFVDPERIAFYGLSYGGKTAMRVPALVDGYCLSICSADFNEWIFKNATVDAPYSYLFTGEYEMFEFDLGSTFNYAEMAALIAPRPFMVERGHDDGVGVDPWIAYEYAKVRRLYAKLGLPDHTRIEYFNGPHQIHGVGTFAFLHHHLDWPTPEQKAGDRGR